MCIVQAPIIFTKYVLEAIVYGPRTCSIINSERVTIHITYSYRLMPFLTACCKVVVVVVVAAMVGVVVVVVCCCCWCLAACRKEAGYSSP